MQARLEAGPGAAAELGASAHQVHERLDQVQAHARALRTRTAEEQGAETARIAAETLARVGKAHADGRVAPLDAHPGLRALRMARGVLDQIAEDDAQRARVGEHQGRLALRRLNVDVDAGVARSGA